jgi:fructose-1,6-bisphosphatase/inositol monophosphatase family enzyme
VPALAYRIASVATGSIDAAIASPRANDWDLAALDIVGIYPNYATAYAAWKEKAQMTVDNAQMRYFIVHLHRLLEPETDDGNS